MGDPLRTGFKRPARVGPRTACDLDGGLGHPIDEVVVTVRCGNYSAFNGYHFTPSDWSELRCGCRVRWRSNARYVAAVRSGH